MQPVENRPIQAPPELVGPDYNLYQYRHDFYKVVRFKSTAPRLGRVDHGTKEDGYKNGDKLPQALSRARRVCLELALCNDWKWFATFTIAQNNFDRKNLDGFYERFSEWLKYQKKKYQLKIPYLLVPEQHGDGSWHMHGFFNADIDRFMVSFRDIWDSGVCVKYELVEKGYFNWPEYQQKFGFCSFGKIRKIGSCLVLISCLNRCWKLQRKTGKIIGSFAVLLRCLPELIRACGNRLLWSIIRILSWAVLR